MQKLFPAKRGAYVSLKASNRGFRSKTKQQYTRSTAQKNQWHDSRVPLSSQAQEASVSMRKIATMVVTRRMGTFTTWSRLKSRQTGSFARLLLAWSAA